LAFHPKKKKNLQFFSTGVHGIVEPYLCVLCTGSLLEVFRAKQVKHGFVQTYHRIYLGCA